MNWEMFSGWADRPPVLNWSAIAANQIGCVYLDPRDVVGAKTAANAIRAHDLVPGIYYATSPDWFPDQTIKQHAQRVSDYVQKAGIIKTGEPVMLDVEEWKAEDTAALIDAVRSHLPSRPLALTVPPGQDSSVVPVQTLVAENVHLYIQLYHGGMEAAPAFEVWPAKEDLIDKGLPRMMIHPFYDAASVPWDAKDGCAFTLNRLP